MVETSRIRQLREKIQDCATGRLLHALDGHRAADEPESVVVLGGLTLQRDSLFPAHAPTSDRQPLKREGAQQLELMHPVQFAALQSIRWVALTEIPIILEAHNVLLQLLGVRSAQVRHECGNQLFGLCVQIGVVSEIKPPGIPADVRKHDFWRQGGKLC